MTRILFAIVATVLLAPMTRTGEPLQWLKKPALTFDEKAKKWHATFELNASTDVEVAIIDPVSNTVVRHLAAGVLGPKAPPPLRANSLIQKLKWDGKDDYQTPVPKPGGLAVRVRVGMSVALKQIVGGDPYAYYSAEMGHNDHSPFGFATIQRRWLWPNLLPDEHRAASLGHGQRGK